MTVPTLERSDPACLATTPLVSVLMITYNHADYLADAIEGVVTQRCEFPFELIIGEDASTDNSREIAFEYQRRYPGIVRVLYSERNVGMNVNGRRVYEHARGEFLAFCEGDDFWCSPDKLAKQVALIRDDPSIGVVHTDWVRSRLENGQWKFDAANSVHSRVPMRYLQGDIFPTWYLPKVLRTCTNLLRKSTIDALTASQLAKREYRFSDNVLNAFVASRSRVAYVPEVTAVYRESPNSALRSGATSRVLFYKSSLEFDADAREFFAGNPPFPEGYRCESAVSLLLWAWRARDFASMKFAAADLWKHFSVFGLIAAGWKSLRMRMRTLRRQRRTIPFADERAWAARKERTSA